MKFAVVARLSEGRSPEFRSRRRINPWNSKHAHLAKPCTLMFYSYDFHYKNPGFLTETGVSDFPRRREVRYHTAAKAVTAVNKPFLRRIRQNPQSQIQFLLKFSVQTGRSATSCPSLLTFSVFRLLTTFTVCRSADA